MQTQKIVVIDKIEFLEKVKKLRNEALENMDTTADLRAQGQTTDYSPRDWEKVSQAYSTIISIIADTQAHQIEINV